MKRLTLGLLILTSVNCMAGQTDRPTALYDSVPVHRKTLVKAAVITTAYYATSIYVLGNTWYKGRERVPFHFYNDNKAYLQVDKLGHAFGGYIYSYLGYSYLRNKNFSQKEALLFGATLGTVLQAPIEIMDGIYEGYGFSWGDILANTLGSAIVFSQAAIFNDQIVKYKFSYWESIYSNQANGYLGTTTFNKILDDYNGHTYWLSFPLKKFFGISKAPDWLNIAVGYGANGMFGEYENITSYNGVAIPKTSRYRQYMLSLDIDWAKIETDSKFLKYLFKGMAFIKLPAPAFEYNSKGEFNWYWLYY